MAAHSILAFTLALLAACTSPEHAAHAALESARAAVIAGDYSRAVEILVDAIDALPTDDRSSRLALLRSLVSAQALARDPESGARTAAAALELAPDEPWLHYAHGTALQELGRYDEAIAAYGHAIDLDSRHVKALQWRGWVLAQLGRHEESVSDFSRALSILEEADETALESWGGDRGTLARWTLSARAGSLEALGRYEDARADRARVEEGL